jgi:endonuclease YncB( thermonuclease family)
MNFPLTGNVMNPWATFIPIIGNGTRRVAKMAAAPANAATLGGFPSMRVLMIAAVLAVAMSTGAQAAEKSCPAFNKPIVKSVEGAAYVKDGDTVVVAGVTVRLKGVDAPEPADKYGPDATEGMRAIVGGWLRCGLTGEKTRNREVGYCTNAADQDIGEAIVKKGLRARIVLHQAQGRTDRPSGSADHANNARAKVSYQGQYQLEGRAHLSHAGTAVLRQD